MYTEQCCVGSCHAPLPPDDAVIQSRQLRGIARHGMQARVEFGGEAVELVLLHGVAERRRRRVEVQKEGGARVSE